MTAAVQPPSPSPASASAPAAAPTADSYPRLVADMGGSNARFGWVSAPGAPVGQVQQLSARDHAGPADAARAYLDGLRQALGDDFRPPRHAAWAVATPVTPDPVCFTNSDWQVVRPDVRRALGLDTLLLLNDFEALALSLPGLGPAQMRCHGAAPARDATLAVLGPGTGLGVGSVVPTRAGWVALPGEGGHVTLAATDDLESAVLAVARRVHGHVSAERLLSGIGLPLLHQSLGEVLGCRPDEPWAPEAIVPAGLDGGDALASQTLDMFCALLGCVAGNLVLTVGARGGCFIGGGIVPRLGDRFFVSPFRQRFEAKGRMSAYLAEVPTALITDTLAALAGAARALDQQLSPPGG